MGASVSTKSTQITANSTNIQPNMHKRSSSRKWKTFKLYSSSMYIIPQDIDYISQKDKIKSKTKTSASM